MARGDVHKMLHGSWYVDLGAGRVVRGYKTQHTPPARLRAQMEKAPKYEPIPSDIAVAAILELKYYVAKHTGISIDLYTPEQWYDHSVSTTIEIYLRAGDEIELEGLDKMAKAAAIARLTCKNKAEKNPSMQYLAIQRENEKRFERLF